MGKKERKVKGDKVDLHTLVAGTLGRLSDELLSRGSVHVEVTGDRGGSFHVQRGGRIDASSPERASVRIRGDADRIAALLGGKRHPTKVFVEGGIVVSGDVRQITALSEELPALTGQSSEE